MKKSHTVLYTYNLRVNKNLFTDPRPVGKPNRHGDGLATPNFISVGILPASASVVLNMSV